VIEGLLLGHLKDLKRFCEILVEFATQFYEAS
jgi:hypothetical protein